MKNEEKPAISYHTNGKKSSEYYYKNEKMENI
jgi:hypothetical protein